MVPPVVRLFRQNKFKGFHKLKFFKGFETLISFKNTLKTIKTRLKKLPPAGGKMVGWYDRCMKIQKLGAPRKNHKKTSPEKPPKNRLGTTVRGFFLVFHFGFFSTNARGLLRSFNGKPIKNQFWFSISGFLVVFRCFFSCIFWVLGCGACT